MRELWGLLVERKFMCTVLRRLCHIMIGLTSYYARYTWATLAFDLNISDHVIAMGLSHETGRANRMVIDYVEGKIELD